MSTHRSLNKLEFKAHMSIHNFVPVSEEESHESTAFTRDRLGKKHLLADEHGKPRIGNLRKKSAILALALFFLSTGILCAEEADPQLQLTRRKGPNIQVTSSDPEVHSADDWMNKDDNKPVSYQKGSTSVGFNDDGEPNVSNRF